VTGRIATAIGALAVFVILLLGAIAGGIASLLGLDGHAGGGPIPSPRALADIPARLLGLYQQAAATCPGLPWTVLAAVGKQESDHGRDPDQTSDAGAVGPMQFLPATFTAYAYPVPPGGANPPTPWDTTDAVYAAARLLCAHGGNGGADITSAVFAYNHSQTYVTSVLATADTYGTVPDAVGAPNTATQTAIDYATAQLGLPYQWGGDGPAAGDAGFDCSGLTHAAYAAAGITLPRTAQTQYDAGPHVPAGQLLLPGDLVFYGTPGHIHHVGLYLGNGQMIDAPDFGQVVKVQSYRWRGDDYWGATSPVDWPRHAG
jgi:cell wall-associated NlpC family hydrolase